MASFEVKFEDKRSARVKNLRYAATLARGRPFVARKLRRNNRKGPWAKYVLLRGEVCCLARHKEVS